MKTKIIYSKPIAVIRIILSIAFISAVSYAEESSKNEDNPFEPQIKEFTPYESNDWWEWESIDDLVLDLESLERADSLGKILEDLRVKDPGLLQDAFDEMLERIINSDDPQAVLEGLASRQERLEEELNSGYSLNSGQNDELDAAANEPYGSTVSNMAEWFAIVGEQFERHAEAIGDRTGANPLISQGTHDPAWMAAQAIKYYQNEINKLDQQIENTLRQALDALDSGEIDQANALRAQADELERQKRKNEADLRKERETFKAAVEENTKDIVEDTEIPGDSEIYPAPDSFDFNDPSVWVILARFGLLADFYRGLDRDYGLVDPEPESGQNVPLPSEGPRADPDISPLINPGNEPAGGDGENIPDEFMAGPQHVDRFGGAVDPEDPSYSSSGYFYSDEKSSTKDGFGTGE